MIRNGLEEIEIIRPYKKTDLGARIRIIFEGAAYRGRGREVIWDGSATLSGNAVDGLSPVNFYNPDKTLDLKAPDHVTWSATTTGGFCGFDLRLADPTSGRLSIETGLVQAEIAIAGIGMEDLVFEAGGLRRRLRVFRMPDRNDVHALKLSRTIPLRRGADNAIYMSMIQEDGFQVWSSPIYVFD